MNSLYHQDNLFIVGDWLMERIRQQIADTQEKLTQQIKQILGTVSTNETEDFYISQDFLDSLLAEDS
jgi:hypothetical protein